MTQAKGAAIKISIVKQKKNFKYLKKIHYV